VLVGAVLCGYVSACAQPAAYFDEGGHACTAIRMGTPTGIQALLMGWLPPYTVPWIANPLLAAGLISLLCRKWTAAAWLGGTAALLGLTSWAYVGIGIVPELLSGYYVWQSSLLLFAVGATVSAVVAARFRHHGGPSRRTA